MLDKHFKISLEIYKTKIYNNPTDFDTIGDRDDMRGDAYGGESL